MPQRDDEGRLIPPTMDGSADPQIRAHVKSEIRKRMKAIRRALPEPIRKERSHEIVRRVASLEEFSTARTVLLFVPLPHEPSIAALIPYVEDRKGRVAFPRVDAETQALTLHLHDAGRPLVPGPMGLMEPSEEHAPCPPEDVGCVIVPGLAFDPIGHRIGYGKGYYDRLLPRLVHASFIGVCFDFQLIAEVPAGDTDVPVHRVVTDRRDIDCASTQIEDREPS